LLEREAAHTWALYGEMPMLDLTKSPTLRRILEAER
jgi:hypothetical protein